MFVLKPVLKRPEGLFCPVMQIQACKYLYFRGAQPGCKANCPGNALLIPNRRIKWDLALLRRKRILDSLLRIRQQQTISVRNIYNCQQPGLSRSSLRLTTLSIASYREGTRQGDLSFISRFRTVVVRRLALYYFQVRPPMAEDPEERCGAIV